MGYRGAKFANIFHGLDEWGEGVVKDYALEGGRVMTKRTREFTPVDTGLLRESWQERLLAKTFSTGFSAWESGTFTDVEYAPYVEYGTGLWGPKHAKYPIRPKNPAGWLHWVGKDGQDHFAKLVMHPGSKGAGMLAKGMQATDEESHVFGEVVLEGRMTELRERWDREAARARSEMTRP